MCNNATTNFNTSCSGRDVLQEISKRKTRKYYVRCCGREKREKAQQAKMGPKRENKRSRGAQNGGKEAKEF